MKNVQACSSTVTLSLAFRHVDSATTFPSRLIDCASGIGLVDSATAQSGRLVDRTSPLSSGLVNRAAGLLRLVNCASALPSWLVNRAASLLRLINRASALPMRLVDRAAPTLWLIDGTAALPSGLVDGTAASSCRLIDSASHISHSPSRETSKRQLGINFRTKVIVAAVCYVTPE